MTQKENEPCGSRNFEEKGENIVSLTKNAIEKVYPIYWFGLNLVKDVINLLIEDFTNSPDGNRKKYNQVFLILFNRSVQHIESTRILTERGLYGNSLVITRSLMSDLAMMQYLHFHPELLDLFLNEKQEDYQINKEFKKAFNETKIENELVERGVKPFGSTFQLLSKASHSSSFGSQLYGSRGKNKEQYHLNYGPKFQPEKAIMIMSLTVDSFYDLVNNVLWHRHHADENMDGEDWGKVKNDLRKLKKDVEIFGKIAMEISTAWPDLFT
ncbi:MAG: hypothetical protein A3G47_02085 [Candidatus Zambryskibacteria bacterium RIFCSPLOWO2_12_FULL_39_45]|uniref:Uncharacterized protein n=3 Tax=Candidatus Zambryskiibacteriota TaxID=1817925 RepID=A0A1G2T9P3_9BACT|nr:MAG: hypothetical protein A3C48_01435 [Candidatus Nealsonbacteria bacterium RIFCSPHIGHO2_02_FULL_38_75]OHA94005.1 MAG: hypothetical protein A2W58_01950 [Candidatus Zambryskibacteria bacterium RIFCSPHIGHO2_02_38_10.5]OHA97233.1 MAG: hypothetical protein A3E32_01105 [Candidatus Zambryskibacteria bacterium RIFCSPHIGHO2_12_FULL_38_37]OHB07396.1 MAG: hypothetical protein A2W64_00550 [Candidatus Zambryskibacteria bacterium RIFCSPLOWO2_02_39_10]OHB09426.1 MAG: hypothetical protein A3I21_01760 [Cand